MSNLRGVIPWVAFSLAAIGCVSNESDDLVVDAIAAPAGDAEDASDPLENDASEPDAFEPEPATADTGSPADARPEPGPPPGGCEGRYTMTSWAVVESFFDASSFSTFLSDSLTQGTLVLSVLTLSDPAGGADQMTLDVAQRGPGGDPLPGAPVGEPLTIGVGPDGTITTRTPGVITFHVQGQIAGYPVDLDARFENATLTGRFAPDCSFLGGRLEAAFSAEGVSLWRGPDTDLDGDGTNDAFFLGSNVQALRVP